VACFLLINADVGWSLESTNLVTKQALGADVSIVYFGVAFPPPQLKSCKESGDQPVFVSGSMPLVAIMINQYEK
jgi:hypothetical protein